MSLFNEPISLNGKYDLLYLTVDFGKDNICQYTIDAKAKTICEGFFPSNGRPVLNEKVEARGQFSTEVTVDCGPEKKLSDEKGLIILPLEDRKRLVYRIDSSGVVVSEVQIDKLSGVRDGPAIFRISGGPEMRSEYERGINVEAWRRENDILAETNPFKALEGAYDAAVKARNEGSLQCAALELLGARAKSLSPSARESFLPGLIDAIEDNSLYKIEKPVREKIKQALTSAMIAVAAP